MGANLNFTLDKNKAKTWKPFTSEGKVLESMRDLIFEHSVYYEH